MKDLYTFDITNEAALVTYQTVRQAYNAFFDDLKLPWIVAVADSGSIGGELSHEYHVLSDNGEDTLFRCQECGFAINQELASEAQGQHLASSASLKDRQCPSCSSPSLESKKAIELGHTFYLGTRYSKPLDLKVVPKPSDQPIEKHALEEAVPLQMGCHGIGISRMIAAVAALYADKRGLNWPRLMAPFEVVIIPRKEHESDVVDVFEALSAQSHPSSLDAIVDDRGKEFVWKMNDADLVGYPVIVILGRKWANGHICEVQCRKLGVKENVHVDHLRLRIKELLDVL